MSFEEISKKARREAKIKKMTPMSFEELEVVVKKWLLIEDRGIIKLACATIIAHRLPTDPIWLFLVAPSGGGKTEFVKSLRWVDDIYPLSTLTPQTFLSGMRGKQDASLLPKIEDKILTFKDFTTILQSHQQAQAEIFGQLREIYDGHYKKDFGTGDTKEWEGKLGFIAGVTSIIDRQHNVHKSLGERFLQYRIEQPDRKEVMDRIEQNILKKEEMDEELSCAFAAYLKSVEIPLEIPRIGDDVKGRLQEVANFVSIARSAVIRDRYTREVEFVPTPEMNTRIYNQIYVVALALSVMNKDRSLTEDDFKILFKLGFDSIHYLRREVLETLRKYDGWVRTDTVGKLTSYSTKTIKRYLEDLAVLGIADINKASGVFIWRLKQEYRDAWKKCEWEASTDEGVLIDDKVNVGSAEVDDTDDEHDIDPNALFDDL